MSDIRQIMECTDVLPIRSTVSQVRASTVKYLTLCLSKLEKLLVLFMTHNDFPTENNRFWDKDGANFSWTTGVRTTAGTLFPLSHARP